jgi:hypothetical protein
MSKANQGCYFCGNSQSLIAIAIDIHKTEERTSITIDAIAIMIMGSVFHDAHMTIHMLRKKYF